MLFSSPAFFLFFLAYYCCHLLVPVRQRIYLIIAGSTIFYAWWKVEYVWLPFLLMAIAYAGVMWLTRALTAESRRRRSAIAIALLFVPLLVFKYTNFVYRDVLGPLFGWQGTLIDLGLPLGVSFVTFTLTAFVVDIQKRRFPNVPGAATTLAYVLFFPHLIAGPILRPNELIPQLQHPRRFPFRRVAVPLAVFTVGLIKKLVLADPIAEVVDGIYAGAAEGLSAPAALLAMYGFSVQIYCDFSGYTDMAIGLALMLGVRLPNNFFRPYAAVSIVDFWRRWHVTLSFWLRDYLYIPLGGSRHGRLQQVRNTVITMVLGGLWHGANWTFVIWGFLHGVAVSAAHALQSSTKRERLVPRWLGVLLTFHLVTVLWVFFRSPNTQVAFQVLRGAVAGGEWGSAAALMQGNLFVVGAIVLFLALHRFDDQRRVKLAARRSRPEVLWPTMLFLWIAAITISQGSSAKFIYFDF